MNLRLTLCCITLLPLSLPAQNSSALNESSREQFSESLVRTPYNPKGDYQTWSLKGKVLPFFIGNSGGISSFLGAEYGFLKNQSIGIDGFLMYTEGSHDLVTDTAGVKHDVGNYSSGTEKAFLLDYRYYFNFKRLRENKGMVFYTLLFLRYGVISNHQDAAYKNDYLTKDEIHRSAGVLLGTTFPFKWDQRFGIDINTGIFEKEKKITTVYRDNNTIKTRFENPTALGYRLSVNLCYWFFRHTPRHLIVHPLAMPL